MNGLNSRNWMSSSIVPSALTPTLILNYSSASIPTAQSASYHWSKVGRDYSQNWKGDCDNHRIQIFTAEGKFLRMFGRHGERRGELDYPNSIAIDNSDRVYVGDWNHRISLFTSEGQFLTSFGRKGEGPQEFQYSRGLVVDVSGVVYVCAYNNYFSLYVSTLL